MELDFKKEIKYILPLVLILAFAFFVNYFKFGNILYDTGREFLVPLAVLDGKILIKDVFLSYFPLSYQINALFFKIFGSSLDTLRILGLISALLINVFIYLTSRFFVSRKKSFIFSLIISFSLMFNVSHLYNYILGYSYAFIYAVLFLFVSLFFALKYIKENKFLYLSYFFLGVCFALKAEFVFLFIPYFLMLLYKKTGLKQILISNFLFFLPLILSFLILFIQGFNFSDLINYFSFMKSFLSSKILLNYNSIVFEKNPVNWCLKMLDGVLKFVSLFLPFFFILYFPIKKNKKVLVKILSFLLFIFLLVAAIHIKDFNFVSIFPFLSLTSLYILYFSYKNKNFPLLFLTLVQIFLLIRINFIYSSGYAAFLMPVGLLVNLLFFAEVIKFENFKKTFLLFMLFLSAINFLYFTTAQNLFANFPIKTNKGLIYSDNKNQAASINEFIKFLNSLNKNETVLILPDGAIFNYFSGLKTNLKYYQLLPNHIETLGEDNIVSNLKINPPNYIVNTNLDYSIYSTPKFCTNFGQKICNFEKESYLYLGNIQKGNDLIFEIYKLKK